MMETAIKHLPFWSDDFDMDLLKIIPDIETILGDLSGVTMWTHGHETFGRLNHPSCWNDEDGVVAFFSFDSPYKDEYYYTSAPAIQCTALEMFRDTWAHGCKVMLEGKLVWNSQLIWPDFETIMWFIRGWGRDQTAHDKALISATKHIRSAVDNLRQIVEGQKT